MARLQLLLVLAAVLLLGTAAAQDDGKTDQARLQGTWSIAKYEAADRAVPSDKALAHLRLVFMDNHLITLRDGKKVDETTFKLDPLKTPKRIDIVASQGPHAGKVSQGIYMLEGDTLVLCSPPAGEKRPTAFKPDAVTRAKVLTLKRVPR